ncbi:MAG: DapH/DapD/GlmU-related protein [Bacteroidia bacterium]|nr:DapH/DapD/GlmU-related protein [Bacteroidia bacterium]
MILSQYLTGFESLFPGISGLMPWQVPPALQDLIYRLLPSLSADYVVRDWVAIHREATVEAGVVLKGPAIISAGCFVGAHAYLRGGVYLGPGCTVGPGCEIKTSLLMERAALAHFNFVGDSLIGTRVNMEAGAVIANHYNERTDKHIRVRLGGQLVETQCEKFGALVGDGCRIGANAVLSPGTILTPHTLVKRLELVEQEYAS